MPGAVKEEKSGVYTGHSALDTRKKVAHVSETVFFRIGRRLYPGSKEGIELAVSYDVKENVFQVRCNNGQLAVLPRVSNKVSIKIEKYE